MVLREALYIVMRGSKALVVTGHLGHNGQRNSQNMVVMEVPST